MAALVESALALPAALASNVEPRSSPGTARSPPGTARSPPGTARSRSTVTALAGGQCVLRPTTSFPTVNRRRTEARDKDEMSAVKSLMQRLCMEPAPMYEGVTALDHNTLEFGFDRGIVTTTESRHQENSRSARSGWAAIHSIPKDHIEWQKQQQKRDEHRRLEERYWTLEERYHDAMLRYAAQEASALRQERRKATQDDPVEADMKAFCGNQLPSEFNPFKMRSRSETARDGTGQVAVAVVVGDTPATKDYWLAKSQEAAKTRARGEDWSQCSRGLSKAPTQRPGLQSGSRDLPVPDPALPHGTSGLEARRRRHVDSKLHEISTPAPVHPCGPGPCFSVEWNPPRRFTRLP